MMKYGLAIKYTNRMKECFVSFSKNGVRISSIFISNENIESIVFSNEHPRIDTVYSAYTNQVYCYINYKEANERKTVILKPITNFWSELRTLCPDKFTDSTNGEPTKLSIQIVYGDKFEPNKKVMNIFKIFSVVLIIFFLFSFLVQKKLIDLGVEIKIPIPFFVMIGIVSSYLIFIFKFYKKKE